MHCGLAYTLVLRRLPFFFFTCGAGGDYMQYMYMCMHMAWHVHVHVPDAWLGQTRRPDFGKADICFRVHVDI